MTRTTAYPPRPGQICGRPTASRLRSVADYALVLLSALVLLYGAFGRRTAAWNLSAPMLAVLAGVIVFGVAPLVDIDYGAVHLLAEVVLVLVLFHDAATVRLADLAHDYRLPLRLLVIGFPVAIALTTGATWVLMPALGLWGALLLAASITPTDAGLGAPTVLNPVVPGRVRRALNVESGLNDGLATPIVLIALAQLDPNPVPGSEESVFAVGVVPVAIAAAVAISVGLLAGRLMHWSSARGWSDREGRQVMMLMAPLLVMGLATVTGGNVFIAAFVGGLVFGGASGGEAVSGGTSKLLQTIADLLSLGVWFIAGGLILDVFAVGVRWQWIVAAILAITVLRMLPVALALSGTGLKAPTVGFIGWFGPRGLASVIFALLALEELGPEAGVIPDVVGTIAVTVGLSVFAHGFSAGPLAARYGAWAARVQPPAADDITELPVTRGRLVTSREPRSRT